MPHGPFRLTNDPIGSFDTHAAQGGIHPFLLVYSSDMLKGFMVDLERLGRADDEAVMMFTEFGRRVRENASQSTDHGTATPMFILGKPVRGGFCSQPPSLTDLDDGNLKMTTDFRSVYATMLNGWMGFEGADAVLKGNIPVLPVFS